MERLRVLAARRACFTRDLIQEALELYLPKAEQTLDKGKRS